MENLRLGVLCLVTWFLFPRVSGAEEFLYLPITRTPVITVGFCGYRTPSGACHGGIDYDVRDDGDGIFAAAAGTVEVAEDGWSNTLHRRRVYGNYVQIHHSNGYLTVYGHLKRGTLEVGVGDEVRAGQLLGTGDNSGWSTGSHLHFEVRDASGRKVDPYGDSPSYPNCGANRLWVNCPPTVLVDEDSDGDTWTIEEGDCDDTNSDIYPGAVESCDGVDEDCDSETDEDWPLLGVYCEAGFGECRSIGVWECEPIVGGSVCNMPYITPGTETCDGLDNDCDRETDETPAELACADTSDCTEDVCLFGLCQNVARDRDRDTRTDNLCGGDDCNDLNSAVWEYTYDQSILSDALDSGSRYPSSVWTGREFGVAWVDYRGSSIEIYFARADMSLAKIGGDVRITTAAEISDYPSLVWTGSEYAIAWSDWRSLIARDVYFTRLDSAGREITSDIRLTEALNSTSSYEPSLVWAGSEFGVAFTNGENGDIYLARLTESGVEIGSEVPVVADSTIQECCPRMVWTGRDYGLVWDVLGPGGREVRFGRFTSTGSLIGSVTVLESLAEMPDSTYPELIWDGSIFSLVWTSNATGNYEIYLSRVGDDGVEIGTKVQLTDTVDASRYPALVWNGAEYGFLWQEISGTYARAYFARIDGGGHRLSREEVFSPCSRDRLSLFWIGHEYFPVWSACSTGMYYEIYLGRVGCGW